MRRIGILSGWLLIAVLPGIDGSAASAAQCRNRISELGGSTAIHRGEPIRDIVILEGIFGDPEEVSVTDNKEEVARKGAANRRRAKYRKAFEEILRAAKLEKDVKFSDIQNAIRSLGKGNPDRYEEGTEMAWMSFRSASTRRIGLLRDACWVNDEAFEAWTIALSIAGAERRFIIPVDCLNLAELKVPSCTIAAVSGCEGKVTVVMTGNPVPGTTIKSFRLESPEERTSPDGRWELTVEPAPDTARTIQIEGTVTDSLGIESASCKTAVEICPKPKPKCKPGPGIPETCQAPSCHISVSTAGNDIFVETSGPAGVSQKPILRSADGSLVSLSGSDRNWKAEQQPAGQYTVELTVDPTPADAKIGCKASTCSATVVLAEPPPACCSSAWFLRSSAAYGVALGSQQRGTYRTPNRQVGFFKLGFNEGLGASVDLEKRLSWRAEKWDKGNWGWSLGVSQLNLKTVWTFDNSGRWISDRESVPVLIATTGPRFHVRRGDLDLHFGPVVGLASFDDATFSDGSDKPGTFDARFDESFVAGVDLGFDAFLGECWGLTGAAQYLRQSTEAEGIDLDVDPLILKFGVVYHF